jgi:uncharacterized Rmd1/YagE family protein
MSQGIDLVNAGLDYYFQHQRTNLGKRRIKIVRTISRTTLGRCIAFAVGEEYSDGQVSNWLQEYRYAQKDKTMLYRIAARGYGRNARWYVLAGPKLDNLDGEGVVMAHAEWIISDASNRVVSDVLHEILPATDRYSGLQDRIDATVKKINHALDGMLADVRADKKWWEKMNKRTIDLIAALTPEQEALVADLVTDEE